MPVYISLSVVSQSLFVSKEIINNFSSHGQDAETFLFSFL